MHVVPVLVATLVLVPALVATLLIVVALLAPQGKRRGGEGILRGVVLHQRTKSGDLRTPYR